MTFTSPRTWSCPSSRLSARPSPRGWLALCAGAALLGIAGCASAPDRYYTLAEPAGTPVLPLTGGTPRASRVEAIEFGPVAVPERLARPQMVLRGAAESAGPAAPAAEVRVLEQHRWASSFEQELRDALAAGVARRLGAADVSRGGRAQGQAVWRVSVQVQAFDAAEADQVAARMQWRLRRPDGTDAGACAWAATEVVEAGIAPLAQGAQRLTARAADAIARQIAALQGGSPLRCEG